MKNIKIDTRKLTTQQQQEKRNIAIKLQNRKLSIKDISDIVEVHTSTIQAQKNKYIIRGKKSIQIAKRGRKIGDKKILSSKQEQEIVRELIDKNPQQLKFKFALWTREVVKESIKVQLDIVVPISTVGHYLNKQQFTSKKTNKKSI